MHTIKKSILMLILSLLLFSCLTGPSSTDDFLTAPLNGKIFDEDNLPCSGVLVTVNKNIKVKSDINGRFVIPDLPKGEHTFILTKDDYEVLEFKFDFINKNQVLWLKMISLDQMIRQIEVYMDDKDYFEATKLIERAQKIDPDNSILFYLSAVFYIQNKRFEEASGELTKIIDKGEEDPIVYLTLADLYQNHLGDPAKALDYLLKYAAYNMDEKIQKRIDYLRSIVPQT
ncbi:MAG: tetratricopeptide repeat protein [Spirochaetales bacterium]|nr:tetratricopeptide repeat protein [Spirochaetales bacterium]